MSDMFNKLPPEAQNKIRNAQAGLPRKGVKIAELARAFGLEVYRGELPPNHSGVIVKNAEKGGSAGYCIVTEKSDSSNRRRFTIAHELAHFLLHRDKIGDNYPGECLVSRDAFEPRRDRGEQTRRRHFDAARKDRCVDQRGRA